MSLDGRSSRGSSSNVAVVSPLPKTISLSSRQSSVDGCGTYQVSISPTFYDKLLGKAFNIDYGNIDFEKAKFELLLTKFEKS